jgi:flagellar P-ring protein precursor FlgI
MPSRYAAALRATLILLISTAMPIPASAAPGPRIKDIVDVENVRSNQLVGYGLVAGLAGTGDRMQNSPFTEESMQAMLERMGVNIRGTQLRSQNVAAVQVSAIGDATSLQGGVLLASSLRALDGEIYAVAQGPVAVSGFRAQGAAASISRGVSTSARIAGGAIVEREVPYAFSAATSVKLALRNPDFTTARRIAAAINQRYPGSAEALDPSTVSLAPAGGFRGSLVDLYGEVENLSVVVDQPARIIVNEASGTVVMGADVTISPVAIAQGGLTVTVSETPVASQPAPFSDGRTVVLPRSQVEVDDGQGRSLALLTQGATLQSLVGGLNALGVSPRDLITILQAVRAAGALQADIEVQ